MIELQRAVGTPLVGADWRGVGHCDLRFCRRHGRGHSGLHGRHATTNIWQLPDTTGMKHEVVMAGGRSAFDSAIRLTGAKLVLAYSPEELANAINENTAMIYTTDLGEKLRQELGDRKDHKVPMLLDDAAGIPPVDNAKLYAGMGIDLYCFSGGKGLCGPQCSGLFWAERT